MSMKQIAYRREWGKPAGRHWMADLAHQEDGAYLILEPGDMTRYEIIIIFLQDTHELLIINKQHEIIHIFSFDQEIVSNNLYRIDNIVTRHLMADVVKIFKTGLSGTYYNWEKACPIFA